MTRRSDHVREDLPRPQNAGHHRAGPAPPEDDHLPQLRPGTVERRRLVDTLRTAHHAGVVTIVAPAGYGKTTLMAQWARADARRAAWVTIDRDDNDPSILLEGIIAAVDRAGLISPGAAAASSSTEAIGRGVAALTGALAAAATPGILLLDHVESLRSRASRDLVAELAVRLPRSTTLAVGTRTTAPVPSPRLRAEGVLLEVGAADLAMTNEEAAGLFAAAGVDLGPDLTEVVARAEGWPVGLYLVALAIAAGAPKQAAVDIGGDDRYIADYLRREVLARLAPERMRFLVRTSILDEMTGPLCDRVVESTGSGQLLERLEDSNLLVIPMDRTRTWFRYHHLMRDLLRSELLRDEPGAVPGLHTRASQWFEEQGMHAAAIRHAQLADDPDRAARIIAGAGRPAFATGHIDTVLGWLEWFQSTRRLGSYPEVACIGAIALALIGNTTECDRWAAHAWSDTARPSPLRHIVRALLLPSGIRTMAADADEALQLMEHQSDWSAAALALLGLAHVWTGDLERGDLELDRAVATAETDGGFPTATFALAMRASIAIERGHKPDATQFAERAVELVRASKIERVATSCLPFVVAARCAIHRGDIDGGRRLLNEGSAVRPALTDALPAISMHSLLDMAAAYIEISDVGGARQIVREAGDIAHRHPDLGELTVRHEAMRRRVSELPAGTVGASALTTAELRLLPFLVTHLSFPEIGERLYVSRHTVKTQAMSVYRKLGVSSRSEAVGRARELGLLG